MIKTAALLAAALLAPVLAASDASANQVRSIPSLLCADRGGAAPLGSSGMLRTRNPVAVTVIECPFEVLNPDARALRIQVAVQDKNPGPLADDDVACQVLVYNRFGTMAQTGAVVRSRGAPDVEGTILTLPVPTLLPRGGYAVRCKLPRLNTTVGSGMGPIQITERTP